MLYDPNEEKDVDVGNVEVQIKRDPTDDNNYRLHLGGKRECSNGSKKSGVFPKHVYMYSYRYEKIRQNGRIFSFIVR